MLDLYIHLSFHLLKRIFFFSILSAKAIFVIEPNKNFVPLKCAKWSTVRPCVFCCIDDCGFLYIFDENKINWMNGSKLGFVYNLPACFNLLKEWSVINTV